MRYKLLVTVSFVAFISLPLALWALGVDVVADENRPIEPSPLVRAERVLDAGVFRDLGGHVRDRLPLRSEAVRLEAVIDLDVFGDSPSQEVLLGSEGWLFYDRPFTLPCISSMPVAELVDRLGRFAAIVADSGRPIRVTIAPDKPAIYPDKLTDELTELGACPAAKRAAFQAALEAAPPTGYLDMWSALEEQRRVGLEVFHPNDTHWNSRAYTLLAALLVDSLSKGLWDPLSVTITEEHHEGDLTRVMGLPSTVPTERHRVHRDGVAVESSEIAVEGGPPLRYSTATGDVPLYQGRIVVLHDSFFVGASSVFQQYFTDTAILNWRSVSFEEIVAAIESADVVVVELVERGSYRDIETVIGSDELLGMLAERLGDGSS